MAVHQIEVTQEDIETGQKNMDWYGDTAQAYSRTQGCPVFLACKRKIPNIRSITQTSLVLETMKRIELPKPAKDFIRQADAQMCVTKGLEPKDPNDVLQSPLIPFSFMLQVHEDGYTYLLTPEDEYEDC